MSESQPPLSLHVVLGAGGVRALSYVGAFKALDEAKVSVRSISASSAGSLIGALFAAGLRPEQLRSALQQADLSRYAGKRRWPWQMLSWPFARYRETKLPDLLRDLIGGDPTFGELEVPLATIALDLLSRRLLVYATETHADMRVSEALAIATAVPGLYAPHEHDGRILIDGGVASELPVWLPVNRERHPILVLSTSSTGEIERPSNLGEYVGAVIEAAVAGRDDELIDQYPRAARVDIDCRGVRSEDFGIAAETKQLLFDAGYRAVRRRLNEGLMFAPNSLRPSSTPEQDVHTRAKASAAHIIYNFYREVQHVGHDIQAGDGAIINVDIGSMSNVTQTIGSSNVLSQTEKTELSNKVSALELELAKLAEAHADEVALLTKRLKEAVEQANRPPEQRKKGLLEISAKGLTDAAQALADIAPTVLTLAGSVAKFIVGMA